jgi:rod shape-determining protein MreC
VEWVKSSFTSHQELAQENTNLKSQLLMQKAEMQKIIALQKENKQLRALLRSSSSITGTFKVAQILAISVDPFLAQAVLDKGKNYDVYVGQPVLDATGVMGQVIQVGELTARVMLISDSRSAVPVQDTRTGVRAIVIGSGPGRPLRLINVAQTADIKEGDELTTSGLDLRFPAGYPVGIVSSVINSSGQHFANIEIKSAANLEKSRQVLLLWEKSAKVNQEARADLDSMSKDGAAEQRLRQSLSNTNL